MGLFKNTREEKECYIKKRIEDALNLSDDDLKKAKYLKEFELIELKEEIKKSYLNMLTTLFITIAGIIISWTTLSNEMIANSISITDTIVTLKNRDKMSDEELEKYENGLKDISDLITESTKIGINYGSFFVIMALGSFGADRIIRFKQNKKRTIDEIEYNILLDEIKRREKIRYDINIDSSLLDSKNIIKEVAIDETDKNNK